MTGGGRLKLRMEDHEFQHLHVPAVSYLALIRGDVCCSRAGNKSNW